MRASSPEVSDTCNMSLTHCLSKDILLCIWNSANLGKSAVCHSRPGCCRGTGSQTKHLEASCTLQNSKREYLRLHGNVAGHAVNRTQQGASF